MIKTAAYTFPIFIFYPLTLASVLFISFYFFWSKMLMFFHDMHGANLENYRISTNKFSNTNDAT